MQKKPGGGSRSSKKGRRRENRRAAPKKAPDASRSVKRGGGLSSRLREAQVSSRKGQERQRRRPAPGDTGFKGKTNAGAASSKEKNRSEFFG